MRYFFEIAYVGTNYHGWQKQQNAVSIQQVIEEKLALLQSGDKIPITGCGRTDTGVHARQFFFHADVGKKHDRRIGAEWTRKKTTLDRGLNFQPWEKKAYRMRFRKLFASNPLYFPEPKRGEARFHLLGIRSVNEAYSMLF